MAKKKSKKKQQSPNDILERAETLFKKNSFQAALREYGKFEKLNKSNDPLSESVAGNMAVCRQEVATVRAAELTKKAHRLLKKGTPEQALHNFEQAFALTGDKHLADIIAGLRSASGDRNMLASADQAEAAGDYPAAAEILAKLHATHPDNELLCRCARCLVMAEEWQQATDSYAKAECSETVDLYNYGFALARQPKYLECLTLWQQIQSEHPDFTEQKKMVQTLFLGAKETLLNEDPAGRQAEIRQQIQSLPDSENLPAAKQLLNRCHSLRLAKLWQENKMQEIGEISHDSDALNRTVLAIHARAAYNHVEAGGSRLSVTTIQQFINFWLSSLFNPTSDKVSKELFDSGLGLVQRYVGYHPQLSTELINQWNDSFECLTILDTLRTTGKIDGSIPLVTPALALQAGVIEDIFVMIRENEKAFPDRQRFLGMGANYSEGAAALLMVQKSDYEGAFTFLDQFDKNSADPFVTHAVEMVLFACGLHALLENDFEKAERLLTEATALSGLSGKETDTLLAILDEENDWDENRLTACVNILSALQASYPSEEVNHALCSVMTRRAVSLYNNDKLNSRVLISILEKATALNPEDETTLLHLDDAKCNLEQWKLIQLVERTKWSAAANLALKSQYPKIRDMFFRYMDQIIEEALDDINVDTNVDNNRTIFSKFHNLAVRVDPYHPVTAQLEREIARMEMKV